MSCVLNAERSFDSARLPSASLTPGSTSVTHAAGLPWPTRETTARNGPMEMVSASPRRASKTSCSQAWKRSESLVACTRVYLCRVPLHMPNPTYSELMAAETAAPSPENRFATELFEGLPKRYDLLAELLSFRQNARWRHELVDRVAAGHPRRILDVATGTAGVAIELARRTGAEVLGVDISEPMLRRGRER